MNIINYLDKKLLELWMWVGDQFFDYGVVAMLPDNEDILGIIYSNDEDFIKLISLLGSSELENMKSKKNEPNKSNKKHNKNNKAVFRGKII